MNPYRIYSFEFSCWGIDMRFIRTLLICGFLFSLVSCGGGGGGKGSTSRDSASGLPPDPGLEANATVIGIDVNDNGVRDEVENQLNDTYRNDPPALTAAMVAAEALQAILVVDAGNRQAAIASMDETSSAALCVLQHLSNNTSKASAISSRIFALTYNTPDRIAQYKAVISAVGVQGRTLNSIQPSC